MKMNIGLTPKDIIPRAQDDALASTSRPKPAVPKKPLLERYSSRTNHVRNMVRRLQERNSENFNVRPSFPKSFENLPVKPLPKKEEAENQASRRTLEDLKAIDEDIEKLRLQIEERDKIIGALREAAEAKDKKFDHLMQEFSKAQSHGKRDVEGSQEPNRSTSSSPSSTPLCNGGLCWTENFVNKNYHESVYAQLLNDHTELQWVFRDLEAKGEEDLLPLKLDTPDVPLPSNAINLIMVEQIRALKEREAQLIWEAEELREQNDLMEFRILELEECRKEFLDKETSEEKHPREEKIVWRERDLEEVSDSGVMSLPTSEDLTSDSELGDAIRNYSPLGGITNLNLLATENLEAGPIDFKLKKSLKSAECLQESGVFVDPEPSSDCAIKHSKASQTEPLLYKTILDILGSSCGTFFPENPGYLGSDDLSAEISKLLVIQKRIQQKASPPTAKGPRAVFGCPHTSSFAFYEERLVQLEDKLKIYESSGDTKNALLAKRLQKELDLTRAVKELGDKVAVLDASNKKLEEEKCEFEEAENDARFQCQRLEIRLQELIDKNAESELEIERLKLRMTEERRREKRKGGLESLVSQYEQRNFELEEKEVEARERLSMMEAAMPAIVAWNVFRMLRSPELANFLPGTADCGISEEKKIPPSDAAVFQKLEELLDDQKKLRREYEKVEESAADREKALRGKIAELETKAAKDRETLEEMTDSLKALKLEREEGNPGAVRAEDVDLFEELKQMVANEIQLRAEIERLEKKEEAYMYSLEKADEIWAGMEANYKRRLHEAEATNDNLQTRVAQLEKTQKELERALEEKTMPETHDKVDFKIEKLISENEKMKYEITRNLNQKFEEHKKFLEAENASLREELIKMKSDVVRKEEKSLILQEQLEMAKEVIRKRETAENLRKEAQEKNRSVVNGENNVQSQISKLTQDMNQKSKELSNLEVTVAELREEVETLEGRVVELVQTIQTNPHNHNEESQFNSEVSRPVVSLNLQPGTGTAVNRHLQNEGEIYFQGAVFTAPSLYHKKLDLLFFFPKPATTLLLQEPPLPFKSTTEMLPPQKAREKLDPFREEELFQLSLKNTELQKTLERMEEEWRLKDKEVEEFQRIAIEILQEQNELELLFQAKKKQDLCNAKKSEALETTFRGEPAQDDAPNKFRTVLSTCILQTANLDKAPKEVSSCFSSLQIALKNMRSKCGTNNSVMKPLVSEGRQAGDNGDFQDRKVFDCASDIEIERRRFEDLSKNDLIKTEKSPRTLDCKSLVINHKLLIPRSLDKSSSTTCSLPLTSDFSEKSVQIDFDLSFAAPIRTIRKVGGDGIFLEWDISQRPPNVTGFEVRLNGVLTHRVRSSTRNKALLHPPNLGEKLSIQVFALSKNGRSFKCSHTTYFQQHLPLPINTL